MGNVLLLPDHQFPVLSDHLELQRVGLPPSGILLRLLLPPVVGLQKSPVDLFLRPKPDSHRLLIVLVSPQIEPLPLEADADPVAPVLQLKYTPETAGIVSAVLPALQDLHAGAINTVKLVDDLLLVLPLKTAAALIIPPHKSLLGHQSLPAAVTDTPPVNGSLPVSSLRRLQSLQPPESLPGKVHISPPWGLAAAATHLPGL